MQLELQKTRMHGRRKELEAGLKNKHITEKKRRTLQRLLWVMVGVLDHDLSLRKLYQVLKTYERIDCVP